MRCPICSEEVRDTDQAERWGPEFAHATCVTAYNAGKAAERERWATAARLCVEATPEQLPLALDALRDVLEA